MCDLFRIKKWCSFSTISFLPAAWTLMPWLILENLFWRWAISNDFVKKITLSAPFTQYHSLRTPALKYYVNDRQIFIVWGTWNLRFLSILGANIVLKKWRWMPLKLQRDQEKEGLCERGNCRGVRHREEKSQRKKTSLAGAPLLRCNWRQA